MKIYLLLLVLFISQLGFSQVKFHSLQEMLSYADAHSAVIQGTTLQNKIQETQEKQAKSYIYPTVAANAGLVDNLTLQSTLIPLQSFNPSAPADSYTEVKFGKQYQYLAGIGANWDVLNFQKKLNYETARLETEVGKSNLVKTKFNQYNLLASTYYSILVANESLKIYTESKQVSVRLLEIAQNDYSKGIISEIELNRAKMKDLDNQKNSEYITNTIQQLYLQLQSQLNTREHVLIEDSIQSDLAGVSDFDEPHPDVQFEQAETKVYAANVKKANALKYPNISLQYQYNFNWISDDFFKTSTMNYVPQQFIGLKVNIPLFNGFQTNNKITESKQQLQLQQLKLENTQLAKDKEDQILKLQVMQTQEQLNKYKEILAIQQTNDQHIDNKYTSGLIGLDERLDKYQDLISIQNQYVQSLAEFALVQYKVAIRQIKF